MHDFSPIHAVVGGALIALALALLLVATGRIAGLSGIAASLLREGSGTLRWHRDELADALLVVDTRRPCCGSLESPSEECP